MPGKIATSWLESEQKASAVWEHMSGQASGVGSELMASVMSGTRSYMTGTKMGSALVTAVPADTVNFTMAAKHIGMDVGRLVAEVTKAFLVDSPHLREEAERLGIAAHSGIDAAIGTKRFEDQVVGEKLMKRLSDFVIRAQGLHAWDAAIRRSFVQEFLGTIGQRAGMAFDDLDTPFARNLLDRYGFKANDWDELSRPENMLKVGEANYLHPDSLPEPLRVRVMSAAYDQRQFAYLAGGSERVRSMSAGAKAGTLAGELARSVFLFKNFPMTMLSTWGMRAAREAGAGRYGTAATLAIGMTCAGALAIQARSMLQGKDPRNLKRSLFLGRGVPTGRRGWHLGRFPAPGVLEVGHLLDRDADGAAGDDPGRPAGADVGRPALRRGWRARELRGEARADHRGCPAWQQLLVRASDRSTASLRSDPAHDRPGIRQVVRAPTATLAENERAGLLLGARAKRAEPRAEPRSDVALIGRPCFRMRRCLRKSPR